MVIYIIKECCILLNIEKGVKLQKILAEMDLYLFNKHPITNSNNDADVHSSVCPAVAWESCAYQASVALWSKSKIFDLVTLLLSSLYSS